MKNIFLYSILFFAFISCQEEVKFNSPSLEGQKDNVFWRAIDSKAILAANGSLSIEGYTRDEILTLKTTSANLGTYILGTNTLNSVIYKLNEDFIFKAGNGIGNGEIVIEVYDAVNKTITGTFKFNAENIDNNPLAGPVLNFQYGRFYKVPIN